VSARVFASLLCTSFVVGCAEGSPAGEPDAATAPIFDAGPDACFAWDRDGDGVDACGDDCDDADETVRPGAPETCADCRDQDCDAQDVACDTGVDVTVTPEAPASGDDVTVVAASDFFLSWVRLRVDSPDGSAQHLDCDPCEVFVDGRTTWTFEVPSISPGEWRLTFTRDNFDGREEVGVAVVCAALSVAGP